MTKSTQPGKSASTSKRKVSDKKATVDQGISIAMTGNHDSTCYTKTFLKDVILRIDFGSRVESLSRTLPQRIASAALNRFPLAEPQKAQLHGITLSPTTFQTSTQETMEWTYHGRNREKTLLVTPDFLAVTNSSYVSFESLSDDYTSVVDALFDSITDLSVSRVGLRYINILDIPGDDPLAWAEYVNEQMLGIVDMHSNAQVLTRVFHIVEFNYDGQQVKFQFGIANPDHPAPIKKRQFILDLDSHFVGAITREEIKPFIGAAHDKIQELFEDSITDRTRSIMSSV